MREGKIYKVNEILNLAYSSSVVDIILIRIPPIGDGTVDGKSLSVGWEFTMVEFNESGVLGGIVNGWFRLDKVKNSTANSFTLLAGLPITILLSEWTPAELKMMVIW